MKMNKKDIIVAIVGLALVFIIGKAITEEVYMNWKENCDKTYGEGNWTVKEITGTTEAPPLYIGQSWKCVNHSVER